MDKPRKKSFFCEKFKESPFDAINIIIDLLVFIFIILTFREQSKFNQRQIDFNQKQLEFNNKQLIYSDTQMVFNQRQLEFNNKQLNYGESQMNFNENQLRPWIKFEPGFILGLQSNIIRFPYILENIGNSPAINISVYTAFTDINLNAEFIYKHVSYPKPIISSFIIYPHDKTSMQISNERYLRDQNYSPDRYNSFDKLRSQLINNPNYLQVIIEYEFNSKKYLSLITYGFRCVADSSTNNQVIVTGYWGEYQDVK